MHTLQGDGTHATKALTITPPWCHPCELLSGTCSKGMSSTHTSSTSTVPFDVLYGVLCSAKHKDATNTPHPTY